MLCHDGVSLCFPIHATLSGFLLMPNDHTGIDMARMPYDMLDTVYTFEWIHHNHTIKAMIQITHTIHFVGLGLR